jgi:RNA polymerase sigma-70 factor (ECF subfamily)
VDREAFANADLLAPDRDSSSPSRELVDNFFRHEYGRLVAVLTRVLGTSHLDLVEDVVQSALLQALQAWKLRGVPDDPGGWLFRVAKNLALDALRRRRTWERIQTEIGTEAAVSESIIADVSFATEIGDELLRMLFVCCDPDLPVESSVALALRTMCGFSPGEIARALLTTEGNVQKRITRAKDGLRTRQTILEPLSQAMIVARLPAVHLVLYLMFNEGYNATSTETPIRGDVCGEAMRLTMLLVEHPLCALPETHALMALMCLHAARFSARSDDRGELLLLAEQDRTRWDGDMIQAGLAWLDRSALGEFPSRYHLEAGISAEHCLAVDFASTNWQRIVALYDLLLALAPSPLQQLNRAIAIAEWKGPAAGLAELDCLPSDPIADRYHLWPAVRGELLRRLGRWSQAEAHFARALRLAQSAADRQLLARRWQECHDEQ